jgi:hypothetical protein
MQWLPSRIPSMLPSTAWLPSVSAEMRLLGESDTSPCVGMSVCFALDRRLHSCHLRGGAISRRRSTISPLRAAPFHATDARLYSSNLSLAWSLLRVVLAARRVLSQPTGVCLSLCRATTSPPTSALTPATDFVPRCWNRRLLMGCFRFAQLICCGDSVASVSPARSGVCTFLSVFALGPPFGHR